MKQSESQTLKSTKHTDCYAEMNIPEKVSIELHIKYTLSGMTEMEEINQ
jgi:hypothetical protein